MKKKITAKGKIKYGARMGSPFKKEDAQAIGVFIENVPKKTPENILKEIEKHEGHPIYKYIEWDDDEASLQYRLHQVRNIVNHITIEVLGQDDRLPVRGFFSIKYVGDVEREYVSLETVFSDDKITSQVVERAWCELHNWTERYRQYNDLKKATKVIEKILKERNKKKRKK